MPKFNTDFWRGTEACPKPALVCAFDILNAGGTNPSAHVLESYLQELNRFHIHACGVVGVGGVGGGVGGVGDVSAGVGCIGG